jgi:hypothetical protein
MMVLYGLQKTGLTTITSYSHRRGDGSVWYYVQERAARHHDSLLPPRFSQVSPFNPIVTVCLERGDFALRVTNSSLYESTIHVAHNNIIFCAHF